MVVGDWLLVIGELVEREGNVFPYIKVKKQT